MAASSGDLAQTLIEGGLAPQAARILANILGNAASPHFSKGADTADATPTESLRLIDADTRRYLLTNLDYSPQAPFQERLEGNPGQYAGGPADHPYKDSQPIASAPPLSSPRVQGGDYVKVENVVDGGSAVSKVDLKLRLEPGRHLRLDPSTKSLEAVSLLTRSETPRFLAAEFQEGEGSELVLGLRNLETATLLLSNGDTRQVFVFPDQAAVGPAGNAAGGSQALESVTVTLSTGATRPVLAWPTAAAGSVPAWWTTATGAVGALKAFVVFDATLQTNGSAISADNQNVKLLASQNVTSVKRLKVSGDIGALEITMTNALATTNYCVVGTAGRNAANGTLLTLNFGGTVGMTPTTTQFRLWCSNADNNNPQATAWNSVAVFE